MKARTVEGAVEELCQMLKWAGIEWDEGNQLHSFTRG